MIRRDRYICILPNEVRSERQPFRANVSEREPALGKADWDIATCIGSAADRGINHQPQINATASSDRGLGTGPDVKCLIRCPGKPGVLTEGGDEWLVNQPIDQTDWRIGEVAEPAEAQLPDRGRQCRIEASEKVDIALDFHGAELLYPVTNCIVAPDSAAMIATMAAINLTATEFEIHVEPSPPGFRGLTHREIGDHSKTLPFLFETPEPFLDQPTGPKTEALELEGKDEFLLAAGRRGLLFTDYDESGKPMKLRVGRHLQTMQQIAKEWSDINPDKPVRIDTPTFADLMKHDVGHFLHDPAQADSEDVYYE
jgi:hypothetical protein